MTAPAPTQLAGRAPVWTAILVGGALSVLLLLLLLRSEHERAREELRDLARERTEVLSTQVLRSMEVLHGIAALYAVRGEVSRAEFRRFVTGALARQPELLALAWDARVPLANRGDFEQRAQGEGLASFHFTDDPAGAAASPERNEYFPVFYLEPLRRNAEAIGFDVASESRRRAALESARDSGQPAATALIRLAQDKSAEAGFLVFEPLYRGQPGTLEERRQSLTGFAVAVFRARDLIEASLHGARARQVDLAVTDDATGQALYGRVPAGLSPDEVHTQTLAVADRRWRLSLSRDRSGQTWPLSPWAAFAGGLAMTGLLARHLHSSQRSAAELALTNAALLQEVVERKRAEAAADSASRAKSEFLANMSHEIRTPLNAILGYAQILSRNTALHPFQRDAIATISRSGDHLLHLISEILDLSKIDAGRMELTPSDFDLAKLLRDLGVMFQLPSEQKRLGLRFQGAPIEAAILVHGDEGKLRQVLINLLGNAVKFTESGRITLSAEPAGGGAWRFGVRDTGIGIPPAAQADVFRPFHRGPGAAHHGGTGLGLTIAHRQVELLGGGLELQSHPGEGSCFSFTIPLTGAASAPPARLPAPEVDRLAEGFQVRALLVDDIPENREVLALLLTGIGAEVQSCATRHEAIAALRTFSADIVLLDMRLPDCEGTELVREILIECAPRPPKLVATSAAALAHEQARYLHAGCDDFLAKPLRAEHVFACLKNLLGVEFTHRDTPPPSPSNDVDFTSLVLSEDLATRLTVAAELHSATVLKSCLNEVEALGPAGARFAVHLRGFLASYDMATVQQLIAQIPSEAAAATPENA
jgi:signal transduction histidine kinase/ActR/RegA family two-component response regulator